MIVSEDVRIQRCRSCDAAIIWAITEKAHKRVPIDAEPVAFRGNITLHLPATDGSPIAHYVTKAERAEMKAAHERSPETAGVFALFQSHFASCTRAGNWRTRRRT